MLCRRACISATGRLPTRPRPCHASLRRPHSSRTPAAGTASLSETRSTDPHGHPRPAVLQQRVVSFAAGDGSYSCALRTSRGRQLIRLSHVSEDDEVVVTLPAEAAGALCQALQQLQHPHDRPLQPVSYAQGSRSFTFQPLKPQQQQGNDPAASLQVTQAGRSPLVLPCSGSAGAPFAQQLLDLLQPLLLTSGVSPNTDSSSSSQEARPKTATVVQGVQGTNGSSNRQHDVRTATHGAATVKQGLKPTADAPGAAKQAAAAALEAAAVAAAADSLIAAAAATAAAAGTGSRVAPVSTQAAQAQAPEAGKGAADTGVQPDASGLSLDSFLLSGDDVVAPDGGGDTTPAMPVTTSSSSSNGAGGHRQQGGGSMTTASEPAREDGLTLADLTAAGWLQANPPATAKPTHPDGNQGSSSSSTAQLAKLVLESMQRNSRDKISSSSSSSSSKGEPSVTATSAANSSPVNAATNPAPKMQQQEQQEQQQQQDEEQGKQGQSVDSVRNVSESGHSSSGTRQSSSSSDATTRGQHASKPAASSTETASPVVRSSKGSRTTRKQQDAGTPTNRRAAAGASPTAAGVSSSTLIGKQAGVAPGASSSLLQPSQQQLSPAQAQELLEGIKAAADASALSQLLISHLESLAAAHLVAAWLRLGQLASSSEPKVLQSLTRLVAGQMQPKLQLLPPLLLQQLLAAAANARLPLPEGFCTAWAGAMGPHVNKLEASQLSGLCLNLRRAQVQMPESFVEALAADAVGRVQVGQLQPPETAAVLSWLAGASTSGVTAASNSSSSSGSPTAADATAEVREGSSSAAAVTLVRDVAAAGFDQLLAVAEAMMQLPASITAAAQGVVWQAALDGTTEPLPTHQLLQLVNILTSTGDQGRAAEVLTQHLQQLRAAAAAAVPHDGTVCNALVLASGVLQLSWRLGPSVAAVCLQEALQLMELVLDESTGHDAAAAEEGLLNAATQALTNIQCLTCQLVSREAGQMQLYLPRMARVLLQAAGHLHLPLLQQLACMQELLEWCGPGPASSSSGSSRSGAGQASAQAAAVDVGVAQEVLLQLPAVLLAHSSELDLSRLSQLAELASSAVQAISSSHGVVVSAMRSAGSSTGTSSSSSSNSMDTPWPAAMQPVAATAAAWVASAEQGADLGASSKAAQQYNQQVMAALQLALWQEAASSNGGLGDCQALVNATAAVLQQQSTGQSFDQQLLTACILMARDSAAMLPSSTQQQLLWVCASWLDACASSQAVPLLQASSRTQSAPQLSVSSVLQLVNEVTDTLAVKPVSGIQFDQLVTTTWAVAAVAATAERQLPGTWRPSRNVLTWLNNAWQRQQQQQQAGGAAGGSLFSMIKGLPAQQAVQLSWAQSVLATYSCDTLVLPQSACLVAAAAGVEAARQLPAGWAVAAVAAAAAIPHQDDINTSAVDGLATNLALKLMPKLSGWPLLLQLQLLACFVDPSAVLCVLPWQQQQQQGQQEAQIAAAVAGALLRAASVPASASADRPGAGTSATTSRRMPVLLQRLFDLGQRRALQHMQEVIWSTCTEVLQASSSSSSAPVQAASSISTSQQSAAGGYEAPPAASAAWLTTHSQPLLGPQLLVPVALAALQLLGATGATLGRARAATLLAGLQGAAVEAPLELQMAFVKVCLEYKVPLAPQLLQAAIAGSRAQPQQGAGSAAAASSPPAAAAHGDTAGQSVQMYLQRLAAAGAGAVQGSTAADEELLPPAADLAAWSWRDLLQLVQLTVQQQLAPSQTWLTAVQSALQPKLVLLDNAKQLVDLLLDLERLGGQLQPEFLQQLSAAADVHLDSLSAASCLQLLGSCAQQGMQPAQRVLVNLINHLERAPVQVDQVPQGMVQLLRCGIRPSAQLLQHWLDVSQQRAAVLPASHINTVLYCLWQWQVVPPVSWLDRVLLNLAPAGRLSSFTASDTITLCHCLVQLGVTPSDQLKFLVMQHLCSVASSCSMEQVAVAQTCLLKWGAVPPKVVTSFLQQMVKLLPTADLAAVAVAVAIIGSIAGELAGDSSPRRQQDPEHGQQQQELQAGVTALAHVLVKVLDTKYTAAAKDAARRRHSSSSSSSSSSEDVQAVADSLVPVLVFLQQWRPQLITRSFMAAVYMTAVTAAQDNQRLSPSAAHFMLEVTLELSDGEPEVEPVQMLLKSAYVNKETAPVGVSREMLVWCEGLQQAAGDTQLVPPVTLANWKQHIRTAGDLEAELVARHRAAQLSPGGHRGDVTPSGDLLALELGSSHPYLLEAEQQGLVQALQDNPFQVAYQLEVGRLQQRLGAAVAQQCVFGRAT